MEVKKSKEADLEQKRTQGFLLGVIVVLALLFVHGLFLTMTIVWRPR